MSENLKAIKVTDSVYWVGAIDWDIREHHGYYMSRGTTYNSYLILAEKITLIDTVKSEFLDEMLSRIKSVIDISEIDIVVANHAEMDHSGCLPDILKLADPSEVYASPICVGALKAHFDLPCEITPVKSGDEISLGNKKLAFMETKMLHWPDSMFSFLKEEGVLFSQDVFGMHYATAKMFVDEYPSDIVDYELGKYFANIMMPMSDLILRMLDSLQDFGWGIKVIASDHGPVWRNNINRPIELYKKWAEKHPCGKVLIVYATMWGSTETMAKYVSDGVVSAGVECEVINMTPSYRSEVAAALLNSDALLVGSSTLNCGVLPVMADILTYIRGLKPKNLIGFSFGSFGWNWKALSEANNYLNEIGVEVVSESVKSHYVPDQYVLDQCFTVGKEIGDQVKKGVGGSE